MKIGISQDILTQYPDTTVAVALLNVEVSSTRNLKGPMEKFLSAHKQEVIRGVAAKGITSENVLDRPVCQSWSRVFTAFEVEPSIQSTIHSLLKRAAAESDKVQASIQAGKAVKGDLGKISTFVDLYNCTSIETETPMGALSASAIKGDIVLRYGQDGETFRPLGKTDEVVNVNSKHIVYADNAQVLTWLWNHRDSKDACIPPATPEKIPVLLFADQAENGAGDAKGAINRFKEIMPNIGCDLLDEAVLTKDNPSVTFTVEAQASGSNT